ncbi:hypothetical protein Dsin_024420 [Dipteronia sinensis]|uniref:KIB1-4 beta-propeller domain-containing protein n=1 Tax=Dipteronia sinensis TaxID=43782 RepID=A0AAE0DVW3_9ROSI|nr:hypothetical protein Dsin_024420 [Dipteronia sinensis]
MATIRARLNNIVVDSVRLGAVCKCWRLVVLVHHQKSKINNVVTNQFPWLLLPQSLHDNNLRFFDLSAVNIYIISLPKNLPEGLCCGYSKGLLAMATGEEFNPILVLFNPISCVQIRLPPVKKIPSFRDCLRT